MYLYRGGLGVDGCRGLAQLDDQNDGTNQGNQVQENSGPGLAGITQTAHYKCQTGNQNCQRIDVGHDGDKAYDGGNDDVKQNGHPVASDRGSAGEIGIVLPHIQIFFHFEILLLVVCFALIYFITKRWRSSMDSGADSSIKTKSFPEDSKNRRLTTCGPATRKEEKKMKKMF